MSDKTQPKEAEMKVEAAVVAEAAAIVAERAGNIGIPVKLATAPSFFVAEADDLRVMAATAVSFEGRVYKLGPMKRSH